MGIEAYRGIDNAGLLRRVWKEVWSDDVFGRAAQLSYFLLFSLIPMLLILSVILGLLAQGPELRQNLLEYFRRMVPGPGFALLSKGLQQVSSSAGGGKLSTGILLTLWGASSGMTAIIAGLNKAYEVREERPWWKQRLIAVVLTVAVSVLTVVALVLLLYGSTLGHWFARVFGFGNAAEIFWKVARWPAAIGFAVIAFLLIYRFAPNVRGQKWPWIVPGAIVAVVLWALLSFGLRLYLHYFPGYGAVYGSLGAVLILLLWLYLSSAALLLGGELNSEIENAAARLGRADAKMPGQKAPRSGE